MSLKNKLEETGDKVKSLSAHVIGTEIGALIGTGIATYNKYAANAAVKVRPELANVSGTDAWLANHYADWLFYNHPLVGLGITVGAGALFGLIATASTMYKLRN